MLQQKCIQCGNTFSSDRKHSKFCSGACRTAFSRSKKDNFQTEKVVKESTKNPVDDIQNKKIAKVIMALIADRKKILSKGFYPQATFVLGNKVILLGLREVIVSNTKYKLPKPKK